MNTKVDYRITVGLGILFFFVGLFLGENVSLYFYILAAISIIFTIFYISKNYEKLKKIENLQTLKEFKEKIKLFDFNNFMIDIDELQSILIKSQFYKEEKSQFTIFSKYSDLGDCIFIITNFLNRDYVKEYINKIYENYKNSKKNGPTIYLIYKFEEIDFNNDLFKSITLEFAKMKLDNQIITFSFDENHTDPRATTVVPLFINQDNQPFAYYSNIFLKSPIRKSDIKYLIKLITNKSSLR